MGSPKKKKGPKLMFELIKICRLDKHLVDLLLQSLSLLGKNAEECWTKRKIRVNASESAE
jgi:hypothetical protein